MEQMIGTGILIMSKISIKQLLKETDNRFRNDNNISFILYLQIAAALTMIYIIFTNDKLHSILIELSQTTSESQKFF